MNRKYTKIVATISDKHCDVDFIQQLFDEGMNVVRLNSAHLNEEGFLKVVNNVRKVSKKIGILIDTKGPEVRTTVAENDKIVLKSGESIKISADITKESNSECINVSYPHFVRDLKIRDKILIDDGEIYLQVVSKDDDHLTCMIGNDAVLGSRKSVNIPGVRINLPSLTEKDIFFIELAVKHNLDFIAHSFVRSKQDVMAVQSILNRFNSPIKIISKIENQEGVDNIEEILEGSYGVMVARGDLGIEVAQEKIPGIQRQLIRKCVKARKPVIVATQMLHSMIENPRPTRAEVADIANAIYSRTDALMLSGETAYGKYPIEAVQTMAKIAKEAEMSRFSENNIPLTISPEDVTSFLAHTSVEAGRAIDLKAIITDTYSGKTAKFLSAYRGFDPIIAICYVERAARELALSYGVFPYYNNDYEGDEKGYFYKVVRHLVLEETILPDDKICYLSGPASGTYGTTFMEINRVATILEEIKRGTKE